MCSRRSFSEYEIGRNIKIIIEQFVDYLSPELTPYEASFYLYLLRNSFIKNGTVRCELVKEQLLLDMENRQEVKRQHMLMHLKF